MPLRAIDTNGGEYIAFDYSADDWKGLRIQRKSLKIIMPCCNSPAGVRTSHLGTQHFYHLDRGDCDYQGESESHMKLKKAVVLGARAAGWMAKPEVSGNAPDGSKWRADVLCKKGSLQVAIEIQTSHQTTDEYARRQRMYEASNVRTLWLVSRQNTPTSNEIPRFSVDESNIKIDLRPYGEQIEIPVTNFVKGVLSKKLRWRSKSRVAVEREINLQIDISSLDSAKPCKNCGKKYNDVAKLNVPSLHVSSLHLGGDWNIEALNNFLNIELSSSGFVLPRFSMDHNRRYLNQACPVCGTEREKWNLSGVEYVHGAMAIPASIFEETMLEVLEGWEWID